MDIFFYSRKTEYGWLSNFHRATVFIDGKVWPTTEHYYQAQKTLDEEDREKIRFLPKPLDAKIEGGKVFIRENWDGIREDVMLKALRAKFSQHSSLRNLLVGTGHAMLHEDSPTDGYWGYTNGSGKDRLGYLLMQVRGELLGC